MDLAGIIDVPSTIILDKYVSHAMIWRRYVNKEPGMLTDRIIELAQRRGVIRAADLEEIGASRTLLNYLTGRGVLRPITRGAFVLSDQISEHETFLQVAAAIPHGVLCLLSALQFHEITTQMPVEEWVAIERGTHEPTVAGIPLRIVRLSGAAFNDAIEEHETDGVIIRVYSPSKTVVDCFKFRNRIGLDVAREALIDTIDQKKATRDEIWRQAKRCRMSRVMQPYLEMVR
jgi:predicted transcriptional regulator of viral defense system